MSNESLFFRAINPGSIRNLADLTPAMIRRLSDPKDKVAHIENSRFFPVLFIPFHCLVQQQHLAGLSQIYPFYKGVVTTILNMGANDLGIRESTAANILSAHLTIRNHHQALKVHIPRHEKPPHGNVKALSVFNKLTAGRDMDLAGDIKPLQVANQLIKQVSKLSPNTGVQIIKDELGESKRHFLCQLQGTELQYGTTSLYQGISIDYQVFDGTKSVVQVCLGYFIGKKFIPTATIHYKSRGFWSDPTPYDQLSWDMIRVGLKHDPQRMEYARQLSTEKTDWLIENEGLFLATDSTSPVKEQRGSFVHPFRMFGNDDLIGVANGNLLHFLGTPITMDQYKALTYGDYFYSKYPAAIARMVRKAVEHEENLDLTWLGSHRQQQTINDPFAPTAIDPKLATQIKKDIKRLSRTEKLQDVLYQKYKTGDQNITASAAGFSYDLLAAAAVNSGRMWRYLIGTSLYKLIPALSSLTQEQIIAINHQLHQSNELNEKITSNDIIQDNSPIDKPGNRLSESQYKCALAALMYPQATIWREKRIGLSWEEAMTQFDFGWKKIARVLSKYIQPTSSENQSPITYLTRVFDIAPDINWT